MQRLTRKRQAQTMTLCANPRCGQEFPDKVHAGQQKKYCNRQCKNKHWEAAEYSDYRKQYLLSDKGKASQQRRTSKYVKTQRGIDLAEKRKIQKEIHRVKVRLSKEPNICQTCRDDIDPMTDRKTYCCGWCDWMGKHLYVVQLITNLDLVVQLSVESFGISNNLITEINNANVKNLIIKHQMANVCTVKQNKEDEPENLKFGMKMWMLWC
jgi:ribosomal protein S18